LSWSPTKKQKNSFMRGIISFTVRSPVVGSTGMNTSS
jgi:hypothetical protein